MSYQIKSTDLSSQLIQEGWSDTSNKCSFNENVPGQKSNGNV